MSRIHLNGRFKSHLSNDQKEAIKVNKEFEKRKIRLSNSGQGYRNKVNPSRTSKWNNTTVETN